MIFSWSYRIFRRNVQRRYDYGKDMKNCPVKKGLRRIQFNHPYEMVGNVITNALSYIYYEEQGC